MSSFCAAGMFSCQAAKPPEEKVQYWANTSLKYNHLWRMHLYLACPWLCKSKRMSLGIVTKSPSWPVAEQPLTLDGETVAGGCWCGIQGVFDVCSAKCEHSGCTLAQGKGPHSPPPWGLDAGSAQNHQFFSSAVTTLCATYNFISRNRKHFFFHRLSIFP